MPCPLASLSHTHTHTACLILMAAKILLFCDCQMYQELNLSYPPPLTYPHSPPSLCPPPSLLLPPPPSSSLLHPPQDSAAHKSRTPTSISPSLGPSSSLLPYPLPPHDYTSHARLYPIMHPGISIPPPMAQSLQPSKPCLTNEMGPPIFMPCK